MAVVAIERAIGVIVEIARAGEIKHYAITGAVAALAYIQPTSTQDLDVLVSIEDFGKSRAGLLLPGPLDAALAARGYETRFAEGVMVEGWPVQFLPVASALDEEALAEAHELPLSENGEISARILRAEHLVAIAVSVGRLKDFARIDTFLAENAVSLTDLKAVLLRHNLQAQWRVYCAKSGRSDPLGLELSS